MEIIFIFTKDSPDQLKVSLNHLTNLSIRLFIIDDSFQKLNQAKNKELSSTYSNVLYYGKNEFDETVKTSVIDLNENGLVFRQLGNNEWNLGYARNFALLISKINNANKVLFLDDDIIIPNTEIVFNTFKLLDQYDFVGANIIGMIDDSIMGHISNDLELIDTDERTLSGGFLAFNFKKIKHPFINVYNEDWIWLFFHSNETKFLQSEGVFQNDYNPYLGYKEKILFQEIGEIIITGILSLNRYDSRTFTSSDVFWINIIKERRNYLIELYEIAVNLANNEIIEMINLVINYLDKINSQFFLELFLDYFNADLLFNELINLK